MKLNKAHCMCWVIEIMYNLLIYVLISLRTCGDQCSLHGYLFLGCLFSGGIVLWCTVYLNWESKEGLAHSVQCLKLWTHRASGSYNAGLWWRLKIDPPPHFQASQCISMGFKLTLTLDARCIYTLNVISYFYTSITFVLSKQTSCQLQFENLSRTNQT